MKLLFAVYQYVVIFLLFLDRLPLALSFTMLKCDFFFLLNAFLLCGAATYEAIDKCLF